MFNKIYINAKKFIQKNLGTLLLYGVFLFLVLCPVNYYIITGGGTFDAANRVSIEKANTAKGSFRMAYVSEVKGTLFTYLLSYVVPQFERESLDEYKASEKESVQDIEFRNTLWLKQTNNDAIYVAYQKAGKTITEKDKKNYVFYIEEQADTDLKIGDEVLQVDDQKIEELSDLKDYVHSKNKGDTVTIQVIRKNKKRNCTAKIYEKDKELFVGISLLQDVTYLTDPEVSFQFKESESGPSGGLIMSLQIYNMLTKQDLTHGLKIVGTGTISKDGNVGEIDGVKYKLQGAVKDQADVFLVPSGRNYQEAIAEKKKKNYQIEVIGVKNFHDAITKLSLLK